MISFLRSLSLLNVNSKLDSPPPPPGTDIVLALSEPSLCSHFGFLKEQNRRLEKSGVGFGVLLFLGGEAAH